MTDHSALVLRAVRWLRGRTHRCDTVFAEMTTAVSETPDVIGWYRGHSTVVEVKTSRSDFFNDKRKLHASRALAGMGQERWYLTPPGLVTADETPSWCGLAYAEPRTIVIVRRAPIRDAWDACGEARVLTSALRRQQLGCRFNPRTAKWEPFVEREIRQANERLNLAPASTTYDQASG